MGRYLLGALADLWAVIKAIVALFSFVVLMVLYFLLPDSWTPRWLNDVLRLYVRWCKQQMTPRRSNE